MPAHRTDLVVRFLACLAVTLLLLPRNANAVPSFATQTGQPCTTCHIGGFGPQLTPFGRAFKIGGYTKTGSQGWQARLPLAFMLLSSFTNTADSQPAPVATRLGTSKTNDNALVDQISLFLAGRVTEYLGGFVQGTYDGAKGGLALDNTDLRLTTPLEVGSSDVRIGLDVNNGPTVQDPFNSSAVWMFPSHPRP